MPAFLGKENKWPGMVKYVKGVCVPFIQTRTNCKFTQVPCDHECAGNTHTQSFKSIFSVLDFMAGCFRLPLFKNCWMLACLDTCASSY